jgi:hypothetical protein
MEESYPSTRTRDFSFKLSWALIVAKRANLPGASGAGVARHILLPCSTVSSAEVARANSENSLVWTEIWTDRCGREISI